MNTDKIKEILLKLFILLFVPWAWYNYEFRWKKLPDTYYTRSWYSNNFFPIRSGELYQEYLCKLKKIPFERKNRLKINRLHPYFSLTQNNYKPDKKVEIYWQRLRK